MRIPNEMWTPEEWLQQFGEHYNLRTAEYVRRCCRGDVLRTGHKCHLPRNWGACRFGRSWLLVWRGPGTGPQKRCK